MMPAPVAKLRNKVLQGIARASELLNARSAREKMMILAFGLAAILAVNYWVWAAPVIGALSEGLPQRSRLKSQIAELREYETGRQDVEKRHQLLVAKLGGLETSLVGTDQVPELLENLSKVARASNVKITSLSPVEATARKSGKTYSAVPIQILATAGTHELGRFLDTLESGDILMKVTNLKITADNQGGRQHRIELGLEAYRAAESAHA